MFTQMFVCPRGWGSVREGVFVGGSLSGEVSVQVREVGGGSLPRGGGTPPNHRMVTWGRYATYRIAFLLEKGSARMAQLTESAYFIFQLISMVRI